MFNNIFVLIGTIAALFAAFFAAIKYYFKPRLQRTRGQLILRAVLYTFSSTIIVSIIAVSASYIRNEIANRIIPFKEESVSVLILPFDPLEDCTSKQEDMAKAVYKNLRKQIIDVSLKDFDVEFLSNGLPEGLSCPNNHEESRKIGEKYKADIVVWGVHFERAFPETSRVCINYTITDPNTYLEKQIGTTGVQKMTTELIYEGNLLNDVNHVVSFLIAQYYYQNSKLSEAAIYFEKSANYIENKKDRVLVDIFFNLGNICSYQLEYKKAIDFYEKSLYIDSDFMRAVVNLGMAYDETGKIQKANEFFNRATKLNALSAIDFNTRAVAYFNLGQYQKALEDCNKAIELNPKLELAYGNRAYAYDELGQYQKAIEDGNTAINLNPKYTTAYINRACTYITLGQYQKAIEDCNKAIELDTNRSLAYYNKACSYSKLHRNDESIQSLQTALEKGFLNLYPIDVVKNDSDLSNIRDDPRYKKLIEKYSKK